MLIISDYDEVSKYNIVLNGGFVCMYIYQVWVVKFSWFF